LSGEKKKKRGKWGGGEKLWGPTRGKNKKEKILPGPSSGESSKSGVGGAGCVRPVSKTRNGRTKNETTYYVKRGKKRKTKERGVGT